MSCRKTTDSYSWRIPERACAKERTHLVKYRSNIWHNLFNNEACQKALNLWKRKCSLARTKWKTIRIKHIDRQKKWHSLPICIVNLRIGSACWNRQILGKLAQNFMYGSSCDQSCPYILMTSQQSRLRHDNGKQSASAREHWRDVSCDVPYSSLF